MGTALAPVGVRPAKRARSRPLVGNFEENVLNNRLEPIRVVDGYTAEVRASCNQIQPSPLRSKVKVSIFSLDDCFPYLGQLDLRTRRYKLPKRGTLQVTLFNPNGTLVKLWLLKYDLTEMPPSSQTFLRQKTFLLMRTISLAPPPPLSQTPNMTLSGTVNKTSSLVSQQERLAHSTSELSIQTPTQDQIIRPTQLLRDDWAKNTLPPSNVAPTSIAHTKRRIKYMIQFNIVSSKSGRIYLNKDLRIFVSKKDDLETATQFSEQIDYELKSFDEMPTNPRYFAR